MKTKRILRYNKNFWFKSVRAFFFSFSYALSTLFNNNYYKKKEKDKITTKKKKKENK